MHTEGHIGRRNSWPKVGLSGDFVSHCIREVNAVGSFKLKMHEGSVITDLGGCYS